MEISKILTVHAHVCPNEWLKQRQLTVHTPVCPNEWLKQRRMATSDGCGATEMKMEREGEMRKGSCWGWFDTLL